MVNLHSHVPSSNSTLEFWQAQVNPTGFPLVSWHRWHGAFAHAEEPDWWQDILTWYYQVWQKLMWCDQERRTYTVKGLRFLQFVFLKTWNIIFTLAVLNELFWARSECHRRQQQLPLWKRVFWKLKRSWALSSRMMVMKWLTANI